MLIIIIIIKFNINFLCFFKQHEIYFQIDTICLYQSIFIEKRIYHGFLMHCDMYYNIFLLFEAFGSYDHMSFKAT